MNLPGARIHSEPSGRSRLHERPDQLLPLIRQSAHAIMKTGNDVNTCARYAPTSAGDDAVQGQSAVAQHARCAPYAAARPLHLLHKTQESLPALFRVTPASQKACMLTQPLVPR